MLIALKLCAEGVLREPSLYLSLYFKTRCHEYYEQLDAVRKTGDWEAWPAILPMRAESCRGKYARMQDRQPSGGITSIRDNIDCLVASGLVRRGDVGRQHGTQGVSDVATGNHTICGIWLDMECI